MLTRDNIFTNQPIDRNCPFCHSPLETLDHLFFRCDVSKQVWNITFPSMNLSDWNASFIDWINLLTSITDSNDKLLFNIALGTSYFIWKARNYLIFRDKYQYYQYSWYMLQLNFFMDMINIILPFQINGALKL